MTATGGTILVVDDESESLALLTGILSGAGYQVRPADSGKLALAAVAAAPPELILLDFHMPGIDGLEVCRRLKAAESSRDIPVMFISAYTDSAERVRGLALGAVDYVTKPFQPAELLARVHTHLELSRLRVQLKAQVATRTRDWQQAIAQLRREVTERKVARQALLETEERFRNIADAAPLMMVVVASDQHATFFNRGWLDFTGRTMDKETGRGWTAGLHPDDRSRVLAEISSAFAARRECNLEYRLRRFDGEYRWLTCRGVPRFEPDGTFVGYVGSMLDVTELKRSQEQALARQKLESLGVLAGGIAHDFNNLLGSILADSELLLADLPEDSPAREGLARIEAIAVRGAEIVRQLMVYAGHETTVRGPVDLAGLIREMLGFMKVSISKAAVLQLDLPENLCPVQANPAQVRQVVMNLITNASDALGGKEGVISISLDTVQLPVESLPDQAEASTCGNSIRLTIADTGVGMTKETEARIFDPFFTTKSKGRGLGLAAVRGIIRSHNGSIDVVSAPGEGSRFEIIWPCSSKMEQATPSIPPEAAAEVSPATGTVLVIEDEDTLRLATVKMLRRRGFSVFEAADGDAGLSLFRTYTVAIDVVLLDLTLPGASGRAVLEEIRVRRPDVRVILTTAYGPERAQAAVGADQVCQYIRKPYQLTELVEMVRIACWKEPGASSSAG